MAEVPSIAAARALVSALVSQGVCDFVLAPGSRSAPLAWTLAELSSQPNPPINLHVRVDERSAAFLALGIAKANRARGVLAPVAVVTTSGTAVANLHPAVLEAHHSGVPLLLLTADRPAELRGTGASQTTDQAKIFGGSVRMFHDVPAPTGAADETRQLRSLAARAVAAATGARDANPGPVHLNLAYRDPLTPGEGNDLAAVASQGTDPPIVILRQRAKPEIAGSGHLRETVPSLAPSGWPKATGNASFPPSPAAGRSCDTARFAVSAQDDVGARESAGPPNVILRPSDRRSRSGIAGSGHLRETALNPAGSGYSEIPGEALSGPFPALTRSSTPTIRWHESLGTPACDPRLFEPRTQDDEGAGRLASAPNTIVIAGDGAGPLAWQLAEARGWPLFAEPTSGATASPNAIVGYRALLELADAGPLRAGVDRVILFGRPTLSRAVQRLLADPTVEVIVVAPGGGPWPDPSGNASAVVQALPPHWFKRGDTTQPSPFLAAWQHASHTAAAVLTALASDDAIAADGGLSQAAAGPLAVARAVSEAHGPVDWLVLGASNPIRDFDLVRSLPPAAVAEQALDAPTSFRPVGPILANRGLAGIDGTISTAIGVALGSTQKPLSRWVVSTGLNSGVPNDSGSESLGWNHPREASRTASTTVHATTRAFVGDLTFLHDAGGLLQPIHEPSPQLQIVVANDSGGSIFETLEHGRYAQGERRRHNQFERVFAVPTSVDIAALCRGYQVQHRLITSLAELRAALANPSSGIEVLEVPVSRSRRADLASQIHAHLVSALG